MFIVTCWCFVFLSLFGYPSISSRSRVETDTPYIRKTQSDVSSFTVVVSYSYHIFVSVGHLKLLVFGQSLYLTDQGILLSESRTILSPFRTLRGTTAWEPSPPEQTLDCRGRRGLMSFPDVTSVRPRQIGSLSTSLRFPQYFILSLKESVQKISSDNFFTRYTILKTNLLVGFDNKS